LEVRLAQQIQELGVRKDSTTSRANLIFSAGLTVFENGQTIHSDGVQSVVSYNILDDQYATVTSQSDAEDRALRQVGDEIKTRLAIFFDRRMAG
jgi:LPS-assembly lipoprotein